MQLRKGILLIVTGRGSKLRGVRIRSLRSVNVESFHGFMVAGFKGVQG